MRVNYKLHTQPNNRVQHDAAGAALNLGATLVLFPCHRSSRSTTLPAAQVKRSVRLPKQQPHIRMRRLRAPCQPETPHTEAEYGHLLRAYRAERAENTLRQPETPHTEGEYGHLLRAYRARGALRVTISPA
jgi:hypothetical protein